MCCRESQDEEKIPAASSTICTCLGTPRSDIGPHTVCKCCLSQSKQVICLIESIKVMDTNPLLSAAATCQGVNSRLMRLPPTQQKRQGIGHLRPPHSFKSLHVVTSVPHARPSALEPTCTVRCDVCSRHSLQVSFPGPVRCFSNSHV